MAFGDLKGSGNFDSTNTTNPTSCTVSPSVSVNVGDLVYVAYAEGGTSNTAGTVTDNLGNTYTPKSAATIVGAFTSLRCYYSRVTVAGTLTQVDVAATASANDTCICVAVYEGPFAASPLDANPSDLQDTASPYTCPATGTLAQADELIVATMAGGATNSCTATAPLVRDVENIVRRPSVRVGHQVVSSTASVAPEYTGTGFASAVQSTNSFKKSSNTANSFGYTML